MDKWKTKTRNESLFWDTSSFVLTQIIRRDEKIWNNPILMNRQDKLDSCVGSRKKLIQPTGVISCQYKSYCYWSLATCNESSSSYNELHNSVRFTLVISHSILFQQQIEYCNLIFQLDFFRRNRENYVK